MLKELQFLKEELLNVFLQDSTERDDLRRERKILKEFKDQIYSGDSLQKILSANPLAPSSNVLNPNISGISPQISQSNNSETSNINNQQRFLLVAACEEIQKLLKILCQPYLIAKTCLKNCEAAGSITKSFQEIMKIEFDSINKKISHVLLNYQDVLPIAVSDSLKELISYYKQRLLFYSSDKADLEQLKTLKYSQIQAPALGYFLVKENKLLPLFEKSSMQIGKLRVQRIGTEFVHHFQKYLSIYVFNRFLIDSDIFPGIVICVKDSKKKKTFFFVQYYDLKVEDIDKCTSIDQQIFLTNSSKKNNNNDALNDEEQKQQQQQQQHKNEDKKPVDMDSFFKQILSSFLSLSFESFIPNYSVCSANGKIYRHQFNTTNEDRTSHSGLKNPLYFFNDCFIMEKASKEDFNKCIDLERCNMANFLGALSALHEFSKSDFKFEFKKGKKLQSLYLHKEQIVAIQAIVQEFSKTQVWLAESVFPVQKGVCLIQVVQQIQPLVVEFSQRIMSKTIQEHLGFMKRISIEDFLLKVASKKALKKYIQQTKQLEDPRFLKDDLSVSMSSSTTQSQQLAGQDNSRLYPSKDNASNSLPIQTPSSPEIKNSAGGGNTTIGSPNQIQNFTGASSASGKEGNNMQSSTSTGTSSAQMGMPFSSGIHLLGYFLDLNLLAFHKKERKVILKYAAENILFMPSVLSLEQAQDLIKRFNKSWRSTQLWSDNYSFVFAEDEDTNQETQTLAMSSSKFNKHQNLQQKEQVFQSQSLSTPMKRISGSSINNRQFESVFVELLGLVFNMNIMSILTQFTFENLKYFDENNHVHIQLIQSFFKFNQVKGDKGYKLCYTLLERSILMKKYKLASILIDAGEGVNIRKDVVVDYLNEIHLQEDEEGGEEEKEQKATETKEAQVTKDSREAKIVFDKKLHLLVKANHATWLSEFNWEKLWRQQLNPKNYKKGDHLLISTHSYGIRCLPFTFWSQLFEISMQNESVDCYEPDPGTENSIHILRHLSSQEQQQLRNSNMLQDIDNNILKRRKESQNVSQPSLHNSQTQIPPAQVTTNAPQEDVDSQNQEQEFQAKVEEKEVPQEQNEDQEKQKLENSEDQENNSAQKKVERKLSVDINIQKSQQQEQPGNIKRQNSGSAHSSSSVEQKDENSAQKASNKDALEENLECEPNDIEEDRSHNSVNIPQDNQASQNVEEQQDNYSKKSTTSDKVQGEIAPLCEDDFNNDEIKLNQTVRLQPMKQMIKKSSSLKSDIRLKRLSYAAEQNYMVQSILLKNYQRQNNNNHNNPNYSSQSTSRLALFHCEQIDILVEECPFAYPGLQFAADSFTKLFSDFARPRSELVYIDGIPFLFRQLLNGCKSLHNILEERSMFQIEKQSLGESIILQILLNYQHQSATDLILEQNSITSTTTTNNANANNREYRIFSVSTSTPFVSPIIRHHSQNYILNVRNLVLCIDGMQDELDHTLFNKFRAINPEKLMDDWLNDLFFEQQKFQTNQNQPMQSSKHFQLVTNSYLQSSNNSEEAILFQKSMVKGLYTRLLRLTKYLKKIYLDDHKTSLPKYSDILQVVSPTLAQLYSRVNYQKSLSLVQRFNLIESNLDSLQSFAICDLPTFYANFSIQKIDAYQSLLEVISSFQSVGPLSAKEVVKHLSKLTRKEQISWEEVFQNAQKNSHIRTILTNAQLEPDWHEPSTTDKIIQLLQAFQLKPMSEFKHLLSHLIFDGCESLTSKMIRNVGAERITTLSLKKCLKITDSDVIRIAESMPLLQFLDLSQNPSLIKLNLPITSRILQSKPIQFPSLKTLILDESIFLLILDIEAPHLQNASLVSCNSLLHLLTSTASLKRISLQGCSSLLEEHTCLYIIEGINCLIDDSTSVGSFKHLLASIALSNHSKLTIYKQYVLTIFGRLFSKIKSMPDVSQLAVTLGRRGLNKPISSKESSSSSFFGFSKKSSISTVDSLNKSCKMSIIHLLFKNPNIKELKFLHIGEDLRESIVSPLLSDLSDKLQDTVKSEDLKFDIDSVDLSDIKLTESNMKHLGQIVALLKSNSSQGLSIFLQASQESQNNGMKFICEGVNKNNINKLDLSKNRLGDAQLEEICKMVENAKVSNRISQLFLKNCRINNKLLIRVGEALQKNETLRLIDLSDNYFDHEGLKQFISYIYDNCTLNSLILDGNTLKGDGFQGIKKGRYLKRLSLEQCELEQNEIQHLCWLIQEHEQLNYIDLSYNKVNSDSTIQLVTSISSATCSLKELVIKKIFDEEYSVQNACRLSDLIANSNTLQTIDLSGNYIGSDGFIHLGRALKQNQSLRVLIINDDSTIGLRGVANFAELIQNNTTLQILEIQGIEAHQESQLEGFKAAWQAVQQRIADNNHIRCNKKNQKNLQGIPFTKKGNTSPTHMSLDQSSFFGGQGASEKLDSHRIKGNSDHFRLGLSIDGGGMRGVIPGYIKREAHEIFDVIGGTSIGGIFALGLGCTLDGKTPLTRGEELPTFFDENGGIIFNSSKMVALWNNLRDKSKYDPAGIENVLKRHFQNAKLSDVLKGTNIIITAMKRENIQGKNQAKIFKSKEALFSDEKNFFIRDVGRATSAAPTYFPSAEIKNINGTKKYSLIDGALGQNNPSKLVLDDIKTEALNSGNEKNFFLLSLSTGTPITTNQISQNAGIFNIVPIINSLGEGSLFFLEKDIEKSSDGQYCRINPDIPIKKSDAELDNTDPKIMEIYKQSAYKVAEKYLYSDMKYGPFSDQNLLDWLAENTARKKDAYI